jgi:hypothetical protein
MEHKIKTQEVNKGAVLYLDEAYNEKDIKEDPLMREVFNFIEKNQDKFISIIINPKKK